MKLCPLFAKIIRPSALKTFRVSASAGFAMGIAAAQEALPREAIESAIDLMQDVADAVTGARGLWASAPLLKDIEQLRAMLPEGEG
jgi:hypothetical protein